jgi:hypothetical protein
MRNIEDGIIFATTAELTKTTENLNNARILKDIEFITHSVLHWTEPVECKVTPDGWTATVYDRFGFPNIGELKTIRKFVWAQVPEDSKPFYFKNQSDYILSDYRAGNLLKAAVIE